MLPELLGVKLSSEAAEYVALTPVVAREMALTELLEHIVDAVGLEPVRVGEILKRGSLVSGATRFRWERLDGTAEDLAIALARLPKVEPTRPLDVECCAEIVLVGRAERIPISAAAGRKRKLFKRRSFWDELMAHAAESSYAGYLYHARADRYRLSLRGAAWLPVAVELLSFSGLRQRIAHAHPEQAEFIVSRRAGS